MFNIKRVLLFGTAVLTAGAVFAADAKDAAAAALAEVESGTITFKSDDGMMYSRNELEHLSRGPLAGGAVAAAAKNRKNSDPVAALADFNSQLKELGIRLIVLPVPPKCAVYPLPGMQPGDAMVYLKPFYAELEQAGIEVLDVSDAFIASGEPVYCRTDAHWSPAGIAVAAKLTADKTGLRGDAGYQVAGTDITVSGDLAKSLNSAAPETETLRLRMVDGGIFSESSPVLVLGDSHTLFLSAGGDMLAEKSGFCEQLAVALGMPVERIGVKGSAATAVRVNLYRKAVKSPEWLKNKKCVIYCFTCREFTESSSGWAQVPVLKK